MIAKAINYLETKSCLRLVRFNSSSLCPTIIHFGFFVASRFVPGVANSIPRLDFKAEDLGGYCYTTWKKLGPKMSAEIHLSPNSACTVTRTILHEVMKLKHFYRVCCYGVIPNPPNLVFVVVDCYLGNTSDKTLAFVHQLRPMPRKQAPPAQHWQRPELMSLQHK